MERRLLALALTGLPLPALADSPAYSGADVAWIAIAAALVFLMQAGFALLESGLSRAKNALNVVMKNYMDLCVGTLVFWALGFGLMFGGNPSGWFGETLFAPSQGDADLWTLLLFQLMFAATAATIASGAMAERTRYAGYLCGAMVITGLIYPLFGGWAWNSDGWLNRLGFIDFAGSTVVHSVGGWCALAGVMVVGPRLGRFDGQGRPREIRGHNLSFVALGGFLLWFGWFGFNGGSTLSASADIALVNLNTQLAAASGAIGAALYRLLMRRPVLLTETVNGSLAGLVGITAGCATMVPGFAIVTGLLAGLMVGPGARLLLALRLDDVVSAVPVHAFAGAWGTLAAGLFFHGDLFDPQRILVQLLGVAVAFAWAFFAALIMYMLLALTTGLRVPALHEQRGLDLSEHAEIGYPEFSQSHLYNDQVAGGLGGRQ
ncbi:ammonium transporter [Alloalcanivorax mobilis]|mgnify:CR=1 FL=1|uniref:ammonium transporter n=1 Tax=Alloalcanivorax mobilis TaxID=2019569 RepID=UPI000B5B0DE6|nr:ammonium transporter [Alloalcanivorax mobilis]ASK34016.1 ammonium transporter [Alcanivorax sp. N3-2A]|tara:strand:- start:28220 stop:29518 length:1299 start_codon:yes stop_codon:yes gene_type:complete